MSDPVDPNLPSPPDSRDRPRVGVDEWVASAEERIERRRGVAGAAERSWKQLPISLRFFLLVAPIALLPLLTNNLYVIRVATNTLIYMLLALGLNVAVGFAGLLDLGYVAFFGFGAYVYAILSSGQFNWHLATWKSIPIVIALSALLGLLLGLPSRRLLGDYLAIVTLFFGQAFYTFVNNANRITLPWKHHPTDFTGGPNGLSNIDQMKFFGYEFNSLRQYFWLALGTLAVVMVLLHSVSESRTGRAWRALREDPLAAEVMSIPVNRLKLLAFMFGAATAGLTGSIFAAVQIGVFPQNFELFLLITIYAMVILGGAGSIGGVVVGAVTIGVTLEILRDADWGRVIFYVLLLSVVFVIVRPRYVPW